MTVVKTRGRPPKNLLPDKPIEFSQFPIWEKQPYEMPEWFERFTLFYLPVPSGYRSLNRAYTKCCEAAGEEIEKTKTKRAKTVPDDWQLADRVYRWEDRARAYWLDKIQKQDGYIEHQLAELREKTLKLVAKNIQKAEAMSDYPIARKTVTARDSATGIPVQTIIEPNGKWSHKDAIEMMLGAQKLLEGVLMLDSPDRAIEILHREGYKVIDDSTGEPVEMGAGELSTILAETEDGGDGGDPIAVVRVCEEE